jgi:carbonic anhydrase
MNKGFEDLLSANDDYAAGFSLGDAKVIRNAGGRVTEDALRSLVVATHLLGARRILVLEHTDCGMTKLSEQEARKRVDAPDLPLGMISDQRASLQEDVQTVRTSPHLPPGLSVIGGLYDVRTGRIEVVVPLDEPA